MVPQRGRILDESHFALYQAASIRYDSIWKRSNRHLNISDNRAAKVTSWVKKLLTPKDMISRGSRYHDSDGDRPSTRKRKSQSLDYGEDTEKPKAGVNTLMDSFNLGEKAESISPDGPNDKGSNRWEGAPGKRRRLGC